MNEREDCEAGKIMYGLVNRALQSLVIQKLGQDAWREICETAQLEAHNFVNFMPYPDDVTYRLAAVAARKMNQTVDQVLEAFGEHWILFTAEEGYGDLMRMCGNTLVEFLTNLNSLHARIQLIHPNLRPPQIICSDIQKNSLKLSYYSTRPGLAAMVVGLLKGLGKRFGVSLTITLVRSREQGCDHDEFELRFS